MDTLRSYMFRHRLPRDEQDMQRAKSTSTGSMLVAPFMQENARKPEPPPLPFINRTDVNYKKTNRFSDHDNRHAFQDHGVYLGDGRDNRLLGRRLVPTTRRLHHTDLNFLNHRTARPFTPTRDSLYSASYLGRPTRDPPVHRRFPKAYEEPESGQIKLDTTTTDWFRPPDVPYKTPLHVMAVSQEPFLPHNPWKYSVNSLRKVYPPYDTKREPVVDNTFNRYGAAFTSGSSSAHARC